MASDVLVFPTSFAQRRLWFLDQIVGGRPVYNVATEISFDWIVARDDLVFALELLVQRHEALRTTFALLDVEPVQVVHDPQPVTISLHDLRALAPAFHDQRYADVAAELIEAPFDLTRAPLMRVALLWTEVEASVAIVVMHHIVTDRWSSQLLQEEIVSACDAVRRRTTPALPEVPVQYGDFAVWQRQLSDTMHRERLAWWLNTLSGAPTTLDLPLDRARPLVPTFNGMGLTFVLPAHLSAGIASLCQRVGATVFMATLAAFKFMLAQHCGATDIVVGTPVAGRAHPDLDRTVGFFVNTIVLRIRLSDGLTFMDLLARVRDVAVEAYAHQDVPFEQLVAELIPERQISVTPLFQTMFTYDPADPDDCDAADGNGAKTVEIHSATAGTAKFDLTLALAESRTGMAGVLEFNSDVFTEASMRIWVRHFHALLEYAVAHPDEPLTGQALMAEGESEQILETWNRTATDFPRHATIPSLFDAVAACHSGVPAVIDHDRCTTYGELRLRSDVLAAQLRARGVRRGTLVGICADRSLEFIVGALAILKSGGAYVPLDPEYPLERLRMMVEDTGLSIVLATPAHAACLHGLAVSTVSLEWPAIAAADHDPADAPSASPAPDDLAYVIYTSGSTGSPKGVAVPHRAVVRLVCRTDYIALAPGDVVGHASNTSFDAATFEIWGALLNGARLVVITRDLVLSPRELVSFLRIQGVTTLFLTTPLFHQIAAIDPASFGMLRNLLFGGDVVDPGLVRRVIRSASPPARLLHVYGPTEATTFATWHLVRDVPDRALTIPIGRPIANTEAYILDAEQRPVPVGVAGELYIGGPGVARGYLGLPEATAARFIANPFHPGSGERLYRTGDQARWLPDGNIEFLGRIDRQVKIRGFRVEPGEVEVILAQCPGVRQVAVVSRNDSAGPYLAAYIAGHPAADVSVAKLRAYARERLPAYMVPSVFVTTADLPLTANGKIDRNALPDPCAIASEPSALGVLPRTDAEQAVAGVWRAVLQRDCVSVEDNFFDLGGHSLLLIQVLERLRPLFPIELTVVDLFRYPTIAALAGEIASRVAALSRRDIAPPSALETAAVTDRAAQLRRVFSWRQPN